MQIFITWSGETSKKVAEALKGWLPKVIQAASTFMSEADIESGDRWGPELSTRLEGCDFGILCLTPTNLQAPWVLFEAGALSKSVEKARVVPFLVGLETSDLTYPLAQFQGRRADEAGVTKVLQSINSSLNTGQLTDGVLQAAFKAFWPEFKAVLEPLVQEASTVRAEAEVASVPPHREERQILEEVLGLVRSQAGEITALRTFIAGSALVYRGPGVQGPQGPQGPTGVMMFPKPPEVEALIRSGEASAALRQIIKDDGGDARSIDFSTDVLIINVKSSYVPSNDANARLVGWVNRLGFKTFVTRQVA